MFEDQFIHIIEVNTSEAFDGISAVVRDNDNNLLAAVIATRRGTPGDRHRLSMAHELGHLTLNLSEDINAEKAAFSIRCRFPRSS